MLLQSAFTVAWWQWQPCGTRDDSAHPDDPDAACKMLTVPLTTQLGSGGQALKYGEEKL